jgi:glycine/D-amino acid oxidase-like deaminating enzyme
MLNKCTFQPAISMDRRTALKIMAALSATALSPVRFARDQPKVTVIGAGIIGAACAYYLSRAGAKVTVLDQSGPATHASRGTFAWLNATWAKQPQSYHYLNQVGLQVWKEVQIELAIPITWQGSLEWFANQARNTKLIDQIKEQQLWGEPARMITSDEVKQLEPHLAVNNPTLTAYSPNDGALDPVQATRTMLQYAQARGANVISPCKALQPVFKKQQLVAVETSKGRIASDKIVLATGAAPDASKIFSDVVIPQRSTPGIIVITKPLKPIVNRIIAAPGVHLHQRSDGRVVLGEQDGPPEGAAHEMRLKGRPNDFPTRALATVHGNRILQTATEYYPALAQAEIEDVFIGWRPLPLDGHPVLGVNPDRPDIYIAIMHSGVSLAALVGKSIAKELVMGEALDELAAYRPMREFSRVKRY